MDAATYPDQVLGLVSLDGSLPTDDEVDRLIPADERARVLAEQEANQERVEFYRTVDQAKARRSATRTARRRSDADDMGRIVTRSPSPSSWDQDEVAVSSSVTVRTGALSTAPLP